MPSRLEDERNDKPEDDEQKQEYACSSSRVLLVPGERSAQLSVIGSHPT